MKYSIEDKAIIVNYWKTHGWGYKKIVNSVPDRNWTLSSVKRIIKSYRATNSIERRVGSGRPRSSRDEEIINNVQQLLISEADNPGTHKSIREAARVLNTHRSTVQRISSRDLNLSAFKKVPVHYLNERQKEQRLQKSLRLVANNNYCVDSIVFTDEKIFCISHPGNPQNDRVYASTQKRNVNAARLANPRSKNSSKVMVSAGISLHGKTRLHFIPMNVKINAHYYSNILLSQGLIPDCFRLYPDGNFVLQQDSAPAHTAELTKNYLNSAGIRYITKEEWPASSPDLNPMDYRIWAILEQRLYRISKRFETIEHLKDSLIEAWNGIDQETITQCIAGPRGFIARLHAVIRARGSHIETEFRKI